MKLIYFRKRIINPQFKKEIVIYIWTNSKLTTLNIMFKKSKQLYIFWPVNIDGCILLY